MNAKLFAACAALSLALIPAAQALADDLQERQMAQVVVTQPSSGQLVIVDPAARTFRLQGGETIYVAPQTVPLEPLAGEEVTIQTKDGLVKMNAPKTGEEYEIEIDEDLIGDDEIEIERKEDLDGGVELDFD